MKNSMVFITLLTALALTACATTKFPMKNINRHPQGMFFRLSSCPSRKTGVCRNISAFPERGFFR